MKVAFVFHIDASFVRTDANLLRRFCDVEEIRFVGKRSYPRVLRMTADADVVYSWFALGYAAAANLVARASGTRSIVVSGGWDVVAMPEIGYGSLLSEWGRLRARVALLAADRVLAFSDWSRSAILSLAPRSNVERAYLCVDTERFQPAAKEDLVVCVAHVSEENLDRKGLRFFVRAARLVPDARFVLVGMHWDKAIDELRKLASTRVGFSGWLPDEDLRSLLSRAKVYVQPSYTEGFGLALAEAMASGCVPVVTNSGAMPEVVGDTGFYVRYGDVEGLAAAIRRALESGLGAKARERAVANFNIEKRLATLQRVFAEIGGGAPKQAPRSLEARG